MVKAAYNRYSDKRNWLFEIHYTRWKLTAVASKQVWASLAASSSNQYIICV